MHTLPTRAVAALRKLWQTEPARVITTAVAIVVFVAAKAGVIIDPQNVGEALALILPILLGGEAIRRTVIPTAKLAQAATNTVWLPTGKQTSWGLTIGRHPLEDAGTFTGGGHKIVWHTTEGGTLDSVVQTLNAKRAAVHFVIDPKTGRVVQCIPLNRAGRGLEHNGGPETNRANCIQVEIVGFAAQSGQWSAGEYRNLAALACLIEHRVPVPRHARSFHRPTKFGPQAFVDFAGHCGHVHVPGNTHVDPGTGFAWPVLLEQMTNLDH